ncbi:hypothetical protein [Rhizobium sp. EC-SD404]|uniref:hypothetical protein n=1 Tax=Rhizobium sp. EC-SD404 TaxID=2038389 RepID=UPI0012524DF1
MTQSTSPKNEADTPEDDARLHVPYRLADIVPIAFPNGGMTVNGLRNEVRKGRLDVYLIAGKHFTTLADIEEMKKRCVVRQDTRD